MTPQQFEQYCVTIKDTGAWGGEPEILALSRAYKVPIHVVQGGVSRIVEHNPGPSPRLFARVARISYHRRMYGLGEVCILYRERYILSTLSSIIILCGQEAPCHKWLARSSRRSLNAYTRIHSISMCGITNRFLSLCQCRYVKTLTKCMLLE
jgi:hypothetical protein